MGKIINWNKRILKHLSQYKNRKSQKSLAGGATDLIDSSIFLAIGVFNVINQIVHGKNMIERWDYTVPFFIIAIVVYYIPFKKYFKFLVFLGSAIYLHNKSPNSTDFSSVVFFLLAYSEIKTKKAIVLVAVATLGTVVYKSTIIGQTNPQTLNMVALYTYLYLRSYYSFFKDDMTNQKHKSRFLTTQQRTIMDKMVIEDLSQKQIAYDLNLTKDDVQTAVKKAREAFTDEGQETISTNRLTYLLGCRYDKKIRFFDRSYRPKRLKRIFLKKDVGDIL